MNGVELKKWCESAAKSIKLVLRSVYVKYFLILWAVFLVALIPLFRANFNYIDDMGRIRDGYVNFNFSRHTSDAIATVVHNGSYISDISPYTQMLAAAIMALSCVLAIKLLTSHREASSEKVKFNFWYLVAALPLGLSPYFMENYSYKFDAPYMALSVLFSIVPFLLYEAKFKYKNLAFAVVSFACTILMCTTYQASSGIFPALAAILALLMFIRKESYKEIGKFIGLSVVGYCLGVLVFQFLIMKPFSTYVDTGIFGLGELLHGTLSNYRSYVRLVYYDFKMHWIVLMLVVYVGFVLSCVLRSKNNKLLSTIFAILIAGFVGAMSFGLYTFIRSPLFVPRSMYGFFVNFALVAIVAVNCRYAYVARLGSLYLGYAFFVFALTYGNALAEQKHYADYRVTLLMEDLNDLKAGENQNLEIAIDGTIGFSTPVENLTSKKYPVLYNLVQPLLRDNSWFWGSYYMFSHYKMPCIVESTTKFDKDGLILVKETRLHNIYQKDNRVLVELK